MIVWRWLNARIQGLHVLGIAIGVLFFAASLSPSLLPRPTWIQGILSGVTLSIGYGLGVLGVGLWRFLQLPTASAKISHVLLRIALVSSLFPIAYSVWRAAKWQNSVRQLMGLEPLSTIEPLEIFAIAMILFVALLRLAHLFRLAFQKVSAKLQHIFAPRTAALLGFLVCMWLVWAISEGIIVRFAMRTIDRSFQRLDAMIDDELPVPKESARVGSADSLIAWESLGNQGRRFVSGGPTASDLQSFFHQSCPQPIRVYVGLNSAETAEARADLALQELIRVRAFERSRLILATPTGTGWVDPASQDTVEYLHRGDIATVAVQYSYLNSPLALLTDAEYGARMAKVVFEVIYGHWRTLPKESRPRLYLFGLSLGSLNSDLSFQLFDVVDDPFDGVLWSGPPFLHRTWRQATLQRDQGSPAWSPRVRNGSVIRFLTQDRSSREFRSAWGSFRIAFLQYGSDPITFFESNAAWQRPEWLNDPRAKDVSSELRWFPVVTFLQLAADMVVGTAPPGFGHNYAARDYLRAWNELTKPQGWTEEELARLQQRLDEPLNQVESAQ